MRMIVVFQKTYPLRHIGHLDLMRTMQRILRRSGLPVRYSKGYNPHILLSFAAPLSVGIVGEYEVMDVPVEGEQSEEVFADSLRNVLPKAMKLTTVRQVSDSFPTLMGLVAGNRYRVEFDETPEGLSAAIEQFMQMEECMALRRTKSGEKMTDIRPYVQEITMLENGFRFTAVNLQSGSVKPDVLLNALTEIGSLKAVHATTYRETILAKDAQGRLVPLEVIEDA